jgi:hypothetical protein
MIIAKTKKIKNKILAISIAEPAIRVNPNSAATIAITKNVAAHRNIVPLLGYILLLTKKLFNKF